MKNTSDSKLKKQLVSGAVYIALAVTVVALTVSTITSTISGSVEENSVKIDGTLYGGSNLKLPEIDAEDFTFDTPVIDVKQGVDAAVGDDGNNGNKGENGENGKDDTEAGTTKSKAEEKGAEENKPEDAASVGNDAVENAEKETLPDKSRAKGEEPAEETFEMGYNGYIKPCTGYISKEFSMDVPVYSATMYDYRTHSGIDIACDVGTPVRAATSGVIADVYDDYLLGTTVVIEHADGIKSVYSNLSPELPVGTVKGRAVQTGETIGGVGSSALIESAEVSHLHFEMSRGGTSLDPEEYIKAAQ